MNVSFSRKVSCWVMSAALVSGLVPAVPAVAEEDIASEDQTALVESATTTDEGIALSTEETNASNGTAPSGTPPTGTPPSGTPPTGTPPDGNAPTGTPPDGSTQNGTPPTGVQAAGGPNTTTYDYSGTYSATLVANGKKVTSTGKTLSATAKNKIVGLAQNAGTLTIKNGILKKSGDNTDGDACNFYGANSILLSVGSGSTLNVSNSTLKATSAGSNGIFATDSGLVNAYNSTITTTSSGTSGGNARGLDATYGGTIVADSMTISTKGDHCAAVATDRGGGYVSCTNSTFKTAGSGSPLIYSTGDIEVGGTTGTATGSQIVGMEGKNSVLVSNSTLKSTSDAVSGSDPMKDGVIIYQSTSGDADTSTGSAARFEAVGSTLESSISSGAFFYLTNTDANIVLSNSTLSFNSSKVQLLNAAGNNSNNWGSAGSNGADVNFTGINQALVGNVFVDNTSSVNMYLLEGSSWKGAVVKTTPDSTWTSHGFSATGKTMKVNLDADSTWVVTGNSTIQSLADAAISGTTASNIVDASGRLVKVVNTSGTALLNASGTSSYKVVVRSGSVSSTVSTSSANEVAGASISRDAFDSLYGTSTAISNTSSTTTKATNPLTVKAVAREVLYKRVKTAKRTVARPIKVTKAKGTVRYTKVSGSSYLTVNKKTGKVTVAKGTPKGTYKIKIRVRAAGNSSYKARAKTVTCKIKVVKKLTNTLKVKAVKRTASASALTSAKVTVARPIKVTKAKGTVRYAKVSGSDYLTVNKKTGKVTVAKGTPAGTYKVKIRVRAAGNSNYKARAKAVTCTIVVE